MELFSSDFPMHVGTLINLDILSGLGIDHRRRKTSPLWNSLGKNEFFRASLYVWYLQYWAPVRIITGMDRNAPEWASITGMDIKINLFYANRFIILP